MIRRCGNQKHFAYKRYGGRGISVCNEWEDVSIFYNWAINNGYEDGYQFNPVRPASVRSLGIGNPLL